MCMKVQDWFWEPWGTLQEAWMCRPAETSNGSRTLSAPAAWNNLLDLNFPCLQKRSWRRGSARPWWVHADCVLLSLNITLLNKKLNNSLNKTSEWHTEHHTSTLKLPYVTLIKLWVSNHLSENLYQLEH